MMEETRLFDINSIELNELFDSVLMELKNKNDNYKKFKKRKIMNDEIHNNIEETEILLNSINVSIAFCYVSH